MVTVGDFASIEKSEITRSIEFSDRSVRLIAMYKSPAVAVEEIENVWKYSGPLSGLLLVCESKTIDCSLPPVSEPSVVEMFTIGNSSKVSEISILNVYSPRISEVCSTGILSSSCIA